MAVSRGRIEEQWAPQVLYHKETCIENVNIDRTEIHGSETGPLNFPYKDIVVGENWCKMSDEIEQNLYTTLSLQYRKAQDSLTVQG